jgi:hypothetical protein
MSWNRQNRLPNLSTTATARLCLLSLTSNRRMIAQARPKGVFTLAGNG